MPCAALLRGSGSVWENGGETEGHKAGVRVCTPLSTPHRQGSPLSPASKPVCVAGLAAQQRGEEGASLHQTHLCFICILYTQPTDDFIRCFLCTGVLTAIHKGSNRGLSTRIVTRTSKSDSLFPEVQLLLQTAAISPSVTSPKHLCRNYMLGHVLLQFLFYLNA